MVPRGLRSLLKSTQPAKLAGSGKYAGYRLIKNGVPAQKVRGVAKRLQRLHSGELLPIMARRAEPRPGGHWAGPRGGQTRGKKVDAQVTRIVNGGLSKMLDASNAGRIHVYHLTRSIIIGLEKRRLTPVYAQRCVASEVHRLGTAADMFCFDAATRSLVVVELKCGHDFGRLASAGMMKPPLQKVTDCVLHRHFAQLSATMALFARETDTLAKLDALDIHSIRGTLLYAGDKKLDFYELPKWWKNKGPALVDAVK